MQIKDNQKIVDSIMANMDKWNFSPYKAQMGGNLSLGNKNLSFQGGLPLSGGGELDHNPFRNQMFGQKLGLGQNNMVLQTQNGYQTPAPVNQGGLGGLNPLAQPKQNGLVNPYQMPKVNPNALNTSHESAHTQPLSFWDKTKNFAGSQSGRALIATGLTGALTAAFGGSPLEALSYGAQSGGKASDVYSNRLNKQDKLNQDQDELRQKAFDNEQSRQLRMDQILTNAELNKTMAEIRYQNALGLGEQKNQFDIEGDNRRFKQDEKMAGVNSGYEIEKSKQALNNQMQMAVFNGDIDKALAIYQMGLDIDKNSKMKQEEARISAAQPTEKIKNYDYFMEKNEPDLARGVMQGGVTPQSEYDTTYERERAKANMSTQKGIEGSEQLMPSTRDAMARSFNAAKTGNGIGPLGAFSAEYGFNWSKNAGKNFADIKSANAAMNALLRQKLQSTGLTGSELNSALEADAYRYTISPYDTEEVIQRKLENFAKDHMGGSEFLYQSSGGSVAKGQPQKIGKYTVVEE